MPARTAEMCQKNCEKTVNLILSLDEHLDFWNFERYRFVRIQCIEVFVQFENAVDGHPERNKEL